jgi:putative ABC transport system ATP-binding protein
MIDIRDLLFNYRTVHEVGKSAFGMRIDAFTVPAGASAALVGPSGSGKTTLLSLIAGTLRPSSGSISVNDQIISNFSERALGGFRIHNVGQVFQTFELLNYLTVIENVMLPWFITGEGRKKEIRKRAIDLLSNVGLESKALSRPDELSQGEQQRVAVCRAMLNHPSILLADEPTGNLDQQNKQNVVDLLQKQARIYDSTLLMVTHDESLLAQFDLVLDIRSLATSPGSKNSQ